MKKIIVFAVFCAVASAGCQTAGHPRGDDFVPATVEDQIVQEFSGFVDFAMNEDYEGIKSLVASSQAQGFDAKAFIQDRFRMKPDSFRIMVWDKEHVGVTQVRGKKTYLSSGAAHVRILATGQIVPIVVNLHWVKEHGGWKILPFPETIN
jgi:hypothetical protein